MRRSARIRGSKVAIQAAPQRTLSRTAPAGRRRRAGLILVLVMLAGAGGFGVGLASYWTDPAPTLPAWSWALPTFSDEMEGSYRESVQGVAAGVERAMRDHPESPDAVSALGLLYYLAHDLPGEQACWERCRQLAPDHALAFSRLVALAEQVVDYERIVKLASEAIEVNPQQAGYRGMLGSALMYLGRYGESRTVLEEHARRGEADADSYLVLGEVCSQLEQYSAARRHYAAAVALAPYRRDALFSLAKICARLGDEDSAAKYQAEFEQAKAAQADVEKGAQSVREALRDEVHIPERLSEILRYVGEAYAAHEEWDRAEESWVQAARLCAQDTESRQRLSDLYGGEGRLEDALAVVRELQQIAPGNRRHYLNEGILDRRLGRFDEAERVFRDMIRLEPTRGEAYAAAAALLLQRRGDLVEAKSLALRAAELEPTLTNLMLVVTIAQQVGDVPAARLALQHALSIEPGNTDLQRLYASLPEQP